MGDSPSTLSVFYEFFAELWVMFKIPKFRSILIWMVVLAAIGTVIFSQLENWSLLDSLYFCVVTLATVGYGDLAPATSAGKVFSIIYMILGLAMITAAVSVLAKQRQVIHAQRIQGSHNEGE